MTDKQKEAIEFFKNDIEKRKQGKNYFVDYEKVMIYEETVLNLIQEQQKDINTYKKTIEDTLKIIEDNEKKDRMIDLIIRKKDRQIDLMAEFIYAMWCVYPGSFTKALRDRGFDDKECGTCESKEKNCLDCIKQYFESKAEKE